MSRTQAVIVPVRVTALMVNDAVRAQDWRRWLPDFTRKSHLSPERDPMSQSTNRPDKGVLVHWELPAALRNGTLQPDGTTTYTPVPTRWLVVRYGGRTPTEERSAAGWLVQSDCLSDTAAPDNSPYAIPASDTDPTPVPKRIGRVLPLDGDLTEPAAVPPGPLTAIGPGLPTFATYQPYNLGVFSMHDPLTGLTGDTLDLSYLVVGWYGTDSDDPLADITADPPADLQERIAERLKHLGWDCPAPPVPARTVCAGATVGVGWQKIGVPPPDRDEAPLTVQEPDKRPVSYGVAESSVDGISTLALAHDRAYWQNPDRLRRLQALQYGLLHQLDTRDGLAAVQQRTREARFEPVAGGFSWDITTTPSAVHDGQEPQPVRPLPEPERRWLAETNEAQRAHDAAARRLARRQERLYELWWYTKELGSLISTLRSPTQRPIRQRLEKLKQKADTELASFAAKVRAERTALNQAPALLKAATPEELDTAVDAEVERLTKLWKRPPIGRPTRTPRPVFHNAREPIVLIKGAKATRLLDDPAVIPCRLSGQTVISASGSGDVTAVRPPGWAALKQKVPATIPPGLPDDLLTEFAALDRHRNPNDVMFADRRRASWTGTDRRIQAVRRGTGRWKQPWTPLLLVWDAEYFAIPYRHHNNAEKLNWEFDDDGYRWRGEGDADANKAVPRGVSGSVLLSAHAVHNIAERLRHVEAEAPGQDPTFLDKVKELAAHLADDSGGSDLISQALDGFTEQLTGRESRVRPRPEAAVADILDGHHTYAPRTLSPVTRRPKDPDDNENWVKAPYYEPLRAGQFRFQHLFLVDRFGRGHEVIHTADRPEQRPKPARAASVIPDATTADGTGDADALVHVAQQSSWAPHLFQLRPRLPQPARLGFDFVSRLDDRRVAYSADEQISAWLVPNHFDRSLLCMAADGHLLGELRPDGTNLAFDRHHQDAPTLGRGSRRHPHLARFLNGLNSSNDPASALADLLATVEAARLAIAPAHPSTAHPTLRMLGRPLALIRARLELEADADPIVPILPSRLAADSPTAEYQKYTWPVLLGSNSSFEDGLIGYYDQDDYTTLHAVTLPRNPQDGYVTRRNKETGLTLRLGDTRLVTLLADPWAGVQADTHILPTAFLRPDPDHIDHALAQMDAVFRIGPILGRLQSVTVEQSDGTETLTKAFSLPLPVVEGGEWSWKRPNGTTIPVTAADSTARITPESRAHLRTGLLHLRNGMTRQRDITPS